MIREGERVWAGRIDLYFSFLVVARRGAHVGNQATAFHTPDGNDTHGMLRKSLHFSPIIPHYVFLQQAPHSLSSIHVHLQHVPGFSLFCLRADLQREQGAWHSPWHISMASATNAYSRVGHLNHWNKKRIRHFKKKEHNSWRKLRESPRRVPAKSSTISEPVSSIIPMSSMSSSSSCLSSAIGSACMDNGMQSKLDKKKLALNCWNEWTHDARCSIYHDSTSL